MKKIVSIHIITCIGAVLIFQNAHCQTFTDAEGTNIRSAETVTSETNSAMPVNTAGYYRNNISVRAVRGFIKEFKEAKNVTWSKSNEGGCTAHFISDSIQTTVQYDSRGACIHILKRYAENKMPDEVRAMVKRDFFDYTIMEVAEFKATMGKENIIYSVVINHKEQYKVLEICKEEIKIVNDYIKL